MAIEYRCPQCGGTDLKVELMAYVPIRQTEEGPPTVETDSPNVDVCDYWDGESYAACQNAACPGCGCYEQLDAHFDQPAPTEVE